jgi:hypothetical protein
MAEESPKTTMVMPHQRYQSVQTRIQPGDWVLSNRSQFTNYLTDTFETALSGTKLQKAEEDGNAKLPSYHSQQRFVAEYLQKDSPYRGLLLYHGLGSGKTAASIATIESMVGKHACVFVPGSLELNFQDEIEKFSSISRNVNTFHKKPIVWKSFDFDDPALSEKYNDDKIKYYQFLISKEKKPKPKTKTKSKTKSKGKTVEATQEAGAKEEAGAKISKEKNSIWLSIPEDEVGNNPANSGALAFKKLTPEQQNEILLQLDNIYHKRYSFHHYNGGLSFVHKILELLEPRDVANIIYQEGNPGNCLYSDGDLETLFTEKTALQSSATIQKIIKKEKDKGEGKKKEINWNKILLKSIEKKKTIIIRSLIDSKKVKGTGSNTLFSLFEKGTFPNPLDNKAVIIDEVHNFISRVAGGGYTCKLPYQFMLHAKNLKIIALSGTPAINTPFEIGLLMNLIRGATTTSQFKFNPNTIQNRERLLKTLKSIPQIDFYQINERHAVCYFTQNPTGFTRLIKEDGSEAVEKSTQLEADKKWESNRIDYQEFQETVLDIIGEKTEIETKDIQTSEFYIFPNVSPRDKISGLEQKRTDFNQKYVDFETNTLKESSKNQFLSRIFGLVSFFYETTQTTEEGTSIFPEKIDIKPVEVPMSDYQFDLYCAVRAEERKLEKKVGSKTNDLKNDIEKGKASFYRVMSRNYLLFVFPHSDTNTGETTTEGDEDSSLTSLRKWPRHFKNLKKASEENMKEIGNQQELTEELSESQNPSEVGTIERDVVVEGAERDDGTAQMEGTYADYLETLYNFLNDEKQTFCTFHRGNPYDLTVLSPKYVEIISRIFQSPGVSLCYSQFKTLEGVRVFTVVLQAHGFRPRSVSSSGEMSTEEMDITIGDNPSMVRLQVDPTHYISVRALGKSDDGQHILFSKKEIEQRLSEIQSTNGDDATTTKNLQDNLYKLSKEASEVVLSLEQLKWISYLFKNYDELQEKAEDKEEKGIWLPIHPAHSEKPIMTQACYLVWESGTDLQIFRAEENSYGQVCQLIFVTLAGAEGISLYAVRQVHLMEPFWNEVKVNQVIGRARRIASHLRLPQTQRNVYVYRYIGTMSEKQKKGDWPEDQKHLQSLSTTMRESDNNETSDEYLRDIADRKQKILDSFLENLKKAAIDCQYHDYAHNITHGLHIQCASTEALPEEQQFIWLPTEKDIQKDTRKSPEETSKDKKLELFVDYKDPISQEPYHIRVLLYPQPGTKQLPIFDWYFQMGFTDHVIGETLAKGQVARSKPIGVYQVDKKTIQIETIRFLRDRKTLDYFKDIENYLAQHELCRSLTLSSPPDLKSKCLEEIQDRVGTEQDVEGDVPAEDIAVAEPVEKSKPELTEGPLKSLLGLDASTTYSLKKIQLLYRKKEKILKQSKSDELSQLKEAMTQYLEHHRS